MDAVLEADAAWQRTGGASPRTCGPRSRSSRARSGRPRRRATRPGRPSSAGGAASWATTSGSPPPRPRRFLEQRQHGAALPPQHPGGRTRRTGWARTTTWKSAGGGRGRTPGGRSPDGRSTRRSRTGRSARRCRSSTWSAAPGWPGPCSPSTGAPGARLLRALTAFAIDRHSPAYEEIRPPTVVLTETMTSTGHLPKFADDAYHLERDDLWLIPTAEVPLTSMHRGEILEESAAPAALHRGDGLLPARGGLGRPRHPRAAAGARVRQGGAVRLHDARGRARGAGRHPGAGRVDAPGARAALPGARPVLRRPRRVRRPAPSTWRPTRPGSTAGSR